jgi:hypothetical protein
VRILAPIVVPTQAERLLPETNAMARKTAARSNMGAKVSHFDIAVTIATIKSARSSQ